MTTLLLHCAYCPATFVLGEPPEPGNLLKIEVSCPACGHTTIFEVAPSEPPSWLAGALVDASCSGRACPATQEPPSSGRACPATTTDNETAGSDRSLLSEPSPGPRVRQSSARAFFDRLRQFKIPNPDRTLLAIILTFFALGFLWTPVILPVIIWLLELK